MEWCIYKHTNIINGKCYIGQTCQDPERRWNLGKSYSRNFKFGKAIDKYGWTSFSHTIIESGINTQSEANEKEIFYINLFNSFINGYNSTKGGDNFDHLGNEVVQISLNNEIIRKYSSSADAERNTGILAQNIAACLIGRQITAGGFYWAQGNINIDNWKPPKNRKDKQIICIETKKVFNSITEASDNMKISLSSISKCVLRQAISAGGYHWCYLLEYDDDWAPVVEKKKGGPCRPIICVETGEIYESITECSILTGVSTQNLSQNCCKNRRTAKGKHYAYVDEYNDNWEPFPEYNSTRRRTASTRKKAVFCLETNEIFPSLMAAEEKTGIGNRLISRCCSGELIQTHGYHFYWANTDFKKT